jgi:hypothetical protein
MSMLVEKRGGSGETMIWLREGTIGHTSHILRRRVVGQTPALSS